MKTELRKKILKIRSEIPDDVRAEKNARIRSRVLELASNTPATVFALFVDYRHEVETRSIIDALLAMGKTVALPIAHFDTGQLTFIAIQSRDCLQKTAKGLWEPPAGSGPVIPAEKLELIITPGSAFDMKGYRMGYGGGFYDRLLANRVSGSKAVGLAFSEQVVENVPTDSHDSPLDGLITDEGTYWFR